MSDGLPDPRAKFTRHPQTREEHLADICSIATSPWPMGTMEEVATQAHKLYSAIGDDSFRELTGLMVTPPRAEECAPIRVDAFEDALADCVASAIGDHADRLEHVCELLVSEEVRDRALDALYSFSLPFHLPGAEQLRPDRDDALPLLRALLERSPPLQGNTRELQDLVEILESRRASGSI